MYVCIYVCSKDLPLLLVATVVKGFGRGSKVLGIPTANMSMEEIGPLVADLPVYMGGCMYVCMYVCMYLCMYVCVSVCMTLCLYLYVYIFMSVCLYVCMYVWHDW